MKKKKYLLLILFIVIGVILYSSSRKDYMQIDIGYQSVTSQTWGALIIKNQGTFEKKLKEKYPDKKVKVVWHDEISGAVINTNMISNKFQLGFMGDMPMILNLYKANTLKDYDSLIIAMDGKGINGKNQSIVIPKNSDVKSVEDLKGKSVSTPIGSSAHYMLMKVLKKHNMLDDVEIVHQDVGLASQLLKDNKTDGFSIWEPYPVFLEKSGSGKILISGEDSEIDYLAGVVATKKFVSENKEVTELFLESLDEAHNYIRDNPVKAAEIFAKESGFDISIAKKEIKNITWDIKISNKDIETLKDKQNFLIDLNQVKKFDISKKIYR